jgi:hypothetical protein
MIGIDCEQYAKQQQTGKGNGNRRENVLQTLSAIIFVEIG